MMKYIHYLLCSLVVIFLCWGALFFSGPIQRPNSAGGPNAQIIAECMMKYARLHEGKYPDGKSSTEVFQKLLDNRIVKDPSLFYIPMEGKTEPVAGRPLKPENVSWDVTAPVDITTSKPPEGYMLPLVYSTGYKVDFLRGAAAIPLVHPYPKYGGIEPTQFYGQPYRRNWLIRLLIQLPGEPPGIHVCYYPDVPKFIPIGNGLPMSEDNRNLIPKFIPDDYNAQGVKYRQLTPDGSLQQ